MLALAHLILLAFCVLTFVVALRWRQPLVAHLALLAGSIFGAALLGVIP